MDPTIYQFGVIGMGVMGHNLLLNFADKGFRVVGYNRSSDRLAELAPHPHVLYTADLDELVRSLERPRKLLLMVSAGKAVDAVIEQLLPLLEAGDMIMDGGNSHFPDTERRYVYLKEKGIDFLGVGVSGGEKGARFGPSIMPGGNPESYQKVAPFLEKASAQIKGDPCVTFLGRGSAGHYVKMVHNGIEYGIMQLISEAYDLLHRGLGLNNDQLHEVFKSWDEGELNSFLIEITAGIFLQPDDKHPDERLVDKILDKAKQKGTGKWTSQNALDLGVPIPNIDVAVMMRYLSAMKEQRVVAGANWHQAEKANVSIDQVKDALYTAIVLCYAQGFALLSAASSEYDYDLNLAGVARIWRGGCIIRATLLEPMMSAFGREPHLANLMVSGEFSQDLKQRRAALAEVVRSGASQGIALPGFSVALAYYDGYHSQRLPANVIQAQRDKFGAHTYERTDGPGVFHTEWED